MHQVFSRPTYDRIAKHILSRDESVRIDILKAFTGISSISSATQLDQHYNPFDSIHNLRKLVNAKTSQDLFDSIRKASKVYVSLDGKEDKQAPDILKGLSNFYDDLTHAFPDGRYRSTVDFLCETNFGYVTIEFQVAQEDYWDKRALAYVASIYGNQLRPGKRYSEIQDVVGVNLIGDGNTPYWGDGNFVRDYTLVDEKNRSNRIPHLRLIQYSLGDVNLDHKDLKDNKSLREWIEFFKSAHLKDHTPEFLEEPVRKAYDMVRVDTLKKEHPELLRPTDEFFSNLTEHDKAVAKKTKIEIAENMLKSGKTMEEIIDFTGLSSEDVKKLRK